VSTSLYHVSSLRWAGEETITLRPGPQGAEGVGVYFSEGEPRFSAAEGARQGTGAIFLIEVVSATGWWRTKPGIARKHNRPRTWHSAGKSVTISGLHMAGTIESTPVITGEGRFGRG
jgi:hypothetical protein